MDLVVRSPAKINWTLRVLGRREDGFHEIESLVSAVTLYDDLAFSLREDDQFILTCDSPQVPTDDRNLICRAAALLRDEAGVVKGCTCRLTKRIPVGGGLGGGSSNGAAALMALNRLWSVGWSRDRLLAAAGQLGSDVAFFVLGGNAVIRGRGERVEPAPLSWHGWIVLILPGLSVSTAEVYRAWRPGEASGMPAAEPQEGPEEPAAVKWMRGAYNMLEAPARMVCPALADLTERATKLVGRPVRISGSGSTLFTAYDTEREARVAADLLAGQLHLQTCVVQPVTST